MAAPARTDISSEHASAAAISHGCFGCTLESELCHQSDLDAFRMLRKHFRIVSVTAGVLVVRHLGKRPTSWISSWAMLFLATGRCRVPGPASGLGMGLRYTCAASPSLASNIRACKRFGSHRRQS